MIRGAEGRHPSTVQLTRWFEYDHLPDDLREVSRQCMTLTEAMLALLPDGPELSAGLRHLLEAKDAFVRQAVAARDEQ